MIRLVVELFLYSQQQQSCLSKIQESCLSLRQFLHWSDDVEGCTSSTETFNFFEILWEIMFVTCESFRLPTANLVVKALLCVFKGDIPITVNCSSISAEVNSSSIASCSSSCKDVVSLAINDLLHEVHNLFPSAAYINS